MGKEPLNIIKLKRQNDMFAAADSRAKDLRIAFCEAEWHHHDFCNAPTSVPNTKVWLLHTTPDLHYQLAIAAAESSTQPTCGQYGRDLYQ